MLSTEVIYWFQIIFLVVKSKLLYTLQEILLNDRANWYISKLYKDLSIMISD